MRSVGSCSTPRFSQFYCSVALALHFAKGPIDKRQRGIAVLNQTFTIPPGERRYEVRGSWVNPFNRDLHASTITPHMHLLGRDMKVTATYPDGTVRPLIHIDDWDFNWQSTYTFSQPISLPAGTRIDLHRLRATRRSRRCRPPDSSAIACRTPRPGKETYPTTLRTAFSVQPVRVEPLAVPDPTNLTEC